jgi:hypothetical protein
MLAYEHHDVKGVKKRLREDGVAMKSLSARRSGRLLVHAGQARREH